MESDLSLAVIEVFHRLDCIEGVSARLHTEVCFSGRAIDWPDTGRE